MAGSITVSSITLDSDNNFSILSNTGAVLVSANGSGLITGVANTSLSNKTITNPTVSGNLSLDSTGTSGIRLPAANTLAFHTAGAEDIRITSDGNVGIGTASPGVKLDVVGGTVRSSISGGTPIFYLNNGTTQHSIQNNSGVLGFFNDGTNQANITAAGLLQFNSGYGSVATAYGCRAWVNFNGTGTVAIRASGNVSSITDNGTGDYTVNFTTAMPDTNYAPVSGITFDGSIVTENPRVAEMINVTTTTMRMKCFETGGGVPADCLGVYVTITR